MPWLHAEVFDYVEDCMYLCNFDSGLCPLKEKRDGRSYAVMRWWLLRRQTVIFSCKWKVSFCTLLFVHGWGNVRAWLRIIILIFGTVCMCFFAIAATRLIVSIICTQLNLGHLAPRGWEPVVISLNCLLSNMNSTNETLLFDRFLIMYDLCVFICIIVMFVFHCTHVRMSYVLNSYLLTYLLTYHHGSWLILQDFTLFS